MKKILLFAILALTARANLNTEAFLEALAMKETGMGWNGKPGPCGELSKWQIMPSVWTQHMGAESFSSAADGARARVCVLRHVAWLEKRIKDAREKPTPERLATCWHYGWTHRRKSSEWGQEVANLYAQLTR